MTSKEHSVKSAVVQNEAHKGQSNMLESVTPSQAWLALI